RLQQPGPRLCREADEADPDGAHGPCRRIPRRGAVPLLGRIELHDRAESRHGRRQERVVTSGHPPIPATRADVESSMFNDRSVLITGGTGSFGRKWVGHLLKNFKPRRLVVYSRDELKQYEMQQEFDQPAMRYFIGDVRDGERLRTAMKG